MGGGREWGGRLFEAGRLLTFSAFRVGANSRLGAYSNKYGTQVKITQPTVEILLKTNEYFFRQKKATKALKEVPLMRNLSEPRGSWQETER